MAQLPCGSESASPGSRTVEWLRVLKLVLTVILLAIAVWNGLAGLPWP